MPVPSKYTRTFSEHLDEVPVTFQTHSLVARPTILARVSLRARPLQFQMHFSAADGLHERASEQGLLSNGHFQVHKVRLGETGPKIAGSLLQRTYTQGIWVAELAQSRRSWNKAPGVS